MTGTQPDLQAIADEVAGRLARETERSTVADYIPELAKADIGGFAIAIAPIKGAVVAGDADEPYSIQSIARWFHDRVRRLGPRTKKVTIVALARKLLVALWKYVTGGGVSEGAKMKTA